MELREERLTDVQEMKHKVEQEYTTTVGHKRTREERNAREQTEEFDFENVTIEECTEVFEIEVSQDIQPHQFTLDDPDLVNVDSVDPKRMSEAGYVSKKAVEMLWQQKSRYGLFPWRLFTQQYGRRLRQRPKLGLL